jgi:hypothetical protein
MKNACIIAITYLLSSCAFSQQWRLFNPAREHYYGYNSSSVDYALRIDSFQVAGNDTVWFPAHRLANNGMDTCLPFIPTQGGFGERIVQKPNGDYDFHYASGDTLHWQMAPTGPWRVLTNRSGGNPYRIEAIPIGTSYGMTPLGISDSLYNVALLYYDSTGASTGNGTIQISKTLGWLTPLVAVDESLIYSFDATSSIVGIDNPVIGIHDVPKEDFFSMQAGDTIQIYEHYYNDWSETTRERWTQDIYLWRSQSSLGDTLFLEVDRAEFFRFMNNWPQPLPYRDTVVDTVLIGSSTHARLDKDFGEIDHNDPNASAWVNKWMTLLEFPGRLLKPLNSADQYQAQNSCLGTHYTIFHWHDEFFIEGLGGPYYSGWQVQEYEHSRWPTFIHVGDSIYGTPMNFDSALTKVADALPTLSVNIFPNPASSEINIDLHLLEGQGKVELILLNLNGQVVQQQTSLSGGISKMDVADLPSGIYFLKLQTAKGRLMKKVVLQ